MLPGQRRTRRGQEATGLTVRRYSTSTAEERDPGGPRPYSGNGQSSGADCAAPGGPVRAVRARGASACAPDPQARRPRPTRTARHARVDGNHGPATTQDPCGLRALPCHHPQPAASRVTHVEVTGEPGATKPARRVREGDVGKGPQGVPRQRPTSALWDPEWGGAFWKTNAYAPYPIWIWLNGHEWAKRACERAGIAYTALDNGFRSCDDPAGLQRICDRCGSGAVKSFFWRWVHRLPSPFTAADLRAGYVYELAFRQFEVSDTRVFDRPAAGRAFSVS